MFINSLIKIALVQKAITGILRNGLADTLHLLLIWTLCIRVAGEILELANLMNQGNIFLEI